MTISPHDIARVLSEALPHMQRYDEETVVVKYGGHAMGAEAMARSFARDIVLMEQTAINPVVVHGGGPQIGELMERLGMTPEFHDGRRITDADTLQLALTAAYAHDRRAQKKEKADESAREFASIP